MDRTLCSYIALPHSGIQPEVGIFAEGNPGPVPDPGKFEKLNPDPGQIPGPGSRFDPVPLPIPGSVTYVDNRCIDKPHMLKIFRSSESAAYLRAQDFQVAYFSTDFFVSFFSDNFLMNQSSTSASL